MVIPARPEISRTILKAKCHKRSERENHIEWRKGKLRPVRICVHARVFVCIFAIKLTTNSGLRSLWNKMECSKEKYHSTPEIELSLHRRKEKSFLTAAAAAGNAEEKKKLINHEPFIFWSLSCSKSKYGRCSEFVSVTFSCFFFLDSHLQRHRNSFLMQIFSILMLVRCIWLYFRRIV